MWGATARTGQTSQCPLNFNPRAPCGARHHPFSVSFWCVLFQSTRPVWGATIYIDTHNNKVSLFQSTRPVWGATTALSGRLPLPRISIHAPRVGRDCGPHSSRFAANTFQSTRPVWGATRPMASLTASLRYFNPRAPCGARRVDSCDGGYQPLTISIHAPRVGRDIFFCTVFSALEYFNPRAPCGARQTLRR